MALHQKKACKIWLWRACDALTGRVVAWLLGKRDDATLRKLLDKIGLQGRTFVTDDWEGYRRVIPENQLFTGKDLTCAIERDNSNVRRRLARFHRRTKVVSRCPIMVDLSLRLHHHLETKENLDKCLSQISDIFA